MPKVEAHANGSFCWMELATTDQAAAKHFYSTLFGWTPRDLPMGPGGSYTMFQLSGEDASAAYTMSEEERKTAPPHWNLYIAVASADETAKRAVELGGVVIAGPFDVASFGRMAVIGDPTRAVFCVWEAKEGPGATVAGEPGTACRADLYTGDPARAKQFYESLFGWKISPGDRGYRHIQNDGEFIGGILSLEPGEQAVPPNWNIYFLVKDCAASTAKATELGAKVYEGPRVVEPVGTFSVVADPQGAVFSLFEEHA